MHHDVESAKSLLSELKRAYRSLPPEIQAKVASLLRENAANKQVQCGHSH